MKITLIAFGIARDILQARQLDLDLESGASLAILKDSLVQQFPAFSKLATLSFAIDEEYREDTFILSPNDEVVIIPPVSGG